jgi:hypothetical protein
MTVDKLLLELYKPEQVYGTPNGGVTLIPLNDTWVGSNCTFLVGDDEEDVFEFTNSTTEVFSSITGGQYGESIYDYRRQDRVLTITLHAQGDDDSVVNLKAGVRQLQAAAAEANQYATNSIEGLPTNKVTGFPYMLKYQTANLTEPVYYVIKSMDVDLAHFHDQISMLNGFAKIPVTFKVSYAAYGLAKWLENLLANGTGAHGFKYWTYDVLATTETTPGWKVVTNTADNFQGINGVFAGGEFITDVPGLLNKGIDHTAGHIGEPDEVATWFRYDSPGTTLANTTQDGSANLAVSNSTTSMGSILKPDGTTLVGWVNDNGTFGISSQQGYCFSYVNGNRVLAQLGNEGIFIATLKGKVNNSPSPTGLDMLNMEWRTQAGSGMKSTIRISDSGFAYYNLTSIGGVDYLATGFLPSWMSLANGANYTIKVIAAGNKDYVFINDTCLVDGHVVSSFLYNSANDRVGFSQEIGGTQTNINARLISFKCIRNSTLQSQDYVMTGHSANFESGSILGTFSGGTYKIVSELFFDTWYRTTGAPVDSAWATATLEQASESSFVYTYYPNTYNLPSTNGQWVRLSSPTAIKALRDGENYASIMRIKLNVPINKVGRIEFKKTAVWAFPGFLDSSLKTLPDTEYVSQSFEQRDLCLVYGLKGDLETNPRIKLMDPSFITDLGAGTPGHYYQEVTLGVRKQKDTPLPFVIDYNSSAGTIAAGSGTRYGGTVTPNQLNYLAKTDFKSRQYQLLLYVSTNAPCGVGFVNRIEASSAGYKPVFTAVPNDDLLEIPNTSNVLTCVNCGTVSLPLSSAKTPISLTELFEVIFFTTANSPTTQINITLNTAIFVPAEQLVYIDTRIASTDVTSYGWSSSSINSTGLVIDSLMKETPGYYIATPYERVIYINPDAGAYPIRFYPATQSSPYPMALGSAIRRIGTSGAPNTAITITDAAMYSILYCPAYEF